VVASTLNLFRNGAVGFIDWLGVRVIVLRARLLAKLSGKRFVWDDSKQKFVLKGGVKRERKGIS
jgi:hypothetical protein